GRWYARRRGPPGSFQSGCGRVRTTRRTGGRDPGPWAKAGSRRCDRGGGLSRAPWSAPPPAHHTTVLLPPCASPERVSQRLDQRELRHQVAARDRLDAARFPERAQQAQRDDEPADPEMKKTNGRLDTRL